MSHYLSPGAYLPHDAPMLLLEDVVSVSDDSAVCRVTVSPSGVLAPFLDPDGNLPGWFALELMRKPSASGLAGIATSRAKTVLS